MISGADLSNQLSFDVQGAAALRLRAQSGDPAALKIAAKQFEAMFVQTMLKTMRATHFTSEGDVFGDSSSLKMYQELLDQQWAQSISSGKGLGLADMLMKQLTPNTAAAKPGQAANTALPSLRDSRPGTAAVASPEAGVAATVAAQVHPTALASAEVDEAGQQASGQGGKKHHNPDRKQRFVESMLPYAQAAEKESGIPARFVLAQAGLESGWGQREIMAADGTASHNLFGIKADGGWLGKAVSTVTTEYRQGLTMKVSAKFRAYTDYAEAFVDYARLLKRRYHDAITAGNNAQAFAAGVANGGYATDPLYADKLRSAIHSVSLSGA
jgi:flagellar protein FlgJ